MHGPPIHEIPLITWLWVAGLSLLSGIASHLQRYQSSKKVKKPILTFVYDVVYCQLAGIITFFMCQISGIEGIEQALAISLGSHMGARLIFFIHNLMRENAEHLIILPIQKNHDHSDTP